MDIKRAIFICIFLCLIGEVSFGKVSYTLEDRDRLIRVEATLKEFKESIDRRFEQIDKRFEQIDKRFEEFKESVDKRFEQVDKRFEQLFTFLWIITGIFTAMTISTISFAIWDRRSMIKPFEFKTKEIETKIKEIEEGKLEKLILALTELAKTDTQLATVLKKYRIL